MEACCGSHYWARVLTDLGHEVRLISPQFVKPCVKSNKNDRNDAEAIGEAAGRPSMRFVPPKPAGQLEIQAVQRIRQRVVANRTRLVNQVRSALGKHGVVVARDITRIRRASVKSPMAMRASLGTSSLICCAACATNWPNWIAGSRLTIVGSRTSSSRMRGANALAKLKVQAQLRQQLWLPQLVISFASRMAANLPPGRGWFPNRDQVAASLDCSGLANEAADTCAPC